jgi:hypothetical protein
MPVPRRPLIFDLDEVDTIVVLYKNGKSSITSERLSAELLEILDSMRAHVSTMCQPPPPRESPLPGGNHTASARQKT